VISGTPLDLTPFGAVLRGLGLAYWVLVLAAVGVALWKPKRWSTKLGAIAAVILVMVAPAVYQLHRDRDEVLHTRARLAGATVHFEMRCKTAGERIARPVKNVEGIVWMKWRPADLNFQNQFALDDPYGMDCLSADCIKNLLRVTRDAARDREGAARHSKGYQFAETVDPADGRWYRYELVVKVVAIRTPEQMVEFKKNTGLVPEPEVYAVALERKAIDMRTARYGVAWDDISTRDDRLLWVAGSALRVFDLTSDEVVAERIGYLMDPGQGSTAGPRIPWGWARHYGRSCPPIENGSNERFVMSVLQPAPKGE
jgi:hypothetical protein